MDRDVDTRAWNIFRRFREEALYCAVPIETPVPQFLLTGEWTFDFSFCNGDPPVVGFNATAAKVGATYNGFYLFCVFGAPRRERH